jgi:membrane protein
MADRGLLVRSFKAWRRNNPAFLAAGISYYAVFSVVPALILALSVTGHIFRKSHTQGALVGELATLFNPDVAASIQALLKSAQKTATTATLVGIGLLLWGASHVFTSLQYVLNIVWQVPKRGGIGHLVAGRLKSFAMILTLCTAVVIFLSLDLGLAFVKHHMPDMVPRFMIRLMIQAASYSLYLGLFTVLFAMVFKFVPQTRVAWKDVWTGAFFTALMFTIARTVIAVYFSIRVIGSLYGAAGSVIVLLVWVYFSMQIFLFGAEFTHEYANASRPKTPPPA